MTDEPTPETAAPVDQPPAESGGRVRTGISPAVWEADRAPDPEPEPAPKTTKKGK